MRNESNFKKVFLSLYHYMCFFILMAFFITCCMVLFLNTMSESMDIEFTKSNIRTAAILTFGNVVFLSFVCTVIDAIRRKLTIDRPVKKIVEAAEKIAKGDYSVRIPPVHSINRADGLEEISDCYNKMAEELSGIETMQTDFISNVSHELKTPLSVIQNYASLLNQNSITDEERITYSQSISKACQKLSDLVSNILILNKLENQKIYPNSVEYNLSEQLRECLLGFENVWEVKNISIITDIADDVYIKSASELMSIVWNNLLSNAFKFTDSGGNVNVSLVENSECISVSISDTGCGISSDDGNRIFDKFYQSDTSHKTEGNGLGLSLVKRVIDIVHADISVSSQKDVGTTFTVVLRKAV